MLFGGGVGDPCGLTRRLIQLLLRDLVRPVVAQRCTAAICGLEKGLDFRIAESESKSESLTSESESSKNELESGQFGKHCSDIFIGVSAYYAWRPDHFWCPNEQALLHALAPFCLQIDFSSTSYCTDSYNHARYHNEQVLINS